MKQRLLVSSILMGLCAALAVNTASAQNADAAGANANKKDSTELQTVTVTGSRISNPNVVSPQPVSVLTAEDIRALGATNLGDVLTRMPQLATTFTMGNSGGAQIGTVGIGAEDLRNLGPQRTLVLV